MATPYTSERQIAIDKTIHGKRAATKSKVDLLGKLDDAYIQAQGNADALDSIAAKYEALRCPDTASRIRLEAKKLKKHVV